MPSNGQRYNDCKKRAIQRRAAERRGVPPDIPATSSRGRASPGHQKRTPVALPVAPARAPLAERARAMVVRAVGVGPGGPLHLPCLDQPRHGRRAAHARGAARREARCLRGPRGVLRRPGARGAAAVEPIGLAALDGKLGALRSERGAGLVLRGPRAGVPQRRHALPRRPAESGAVLHGVAAEAGPHRHALLLLTKLREGSRRRLLAARRRRDAAALAEGARGLGEDAQGAAGRGGAPRRGRARRSDDGPPEGAREVLRSAPDGEPTRAPIRGVHAMLRRRRVLGPRRRRGLQQRDVSLRGVVDAAHVHYLLRELRKRRELARAAAPKVCAAQANFAERGGPRRHRRRGRSRAVRRDLVTCAV